ncbi:HTH-type transcriptional regulator RutR [Aliiglaciecola sp. 3_MG-2023]|uniref:HTH-type transcriptional regulator RutR n=1 Tax=Aliiglaciecola sp. 3_MG-2023 TaxID=3062644 RepID=UPI0026E322BF|nr:HTH-type transcriptional regulator RutR [Aliiglaciecola sp. 3_MG-2023]MDO6692939.1 HTH-type transcriptional regulator RutR [Aliiglaciecola sp. 3_MG-2023]
MSSTPAKKSLKKSTRESSSKTQSKRIEAKRNKRKIIMQAALDLFSSNGVHGTSVEQIADLAKVSKTNLLYYFASKELLYVEVIQQLLDVWLVPLKGFNSEQDPIEAIANYIEVKLALSRDNPKESRLFCMEVVQGAPLLFNQLGSPLRAIVEAKVQVISDWIKAGKLAPIDPYHLIFSIWATTQHYADFRVQVEAVTGQSLDNPEFFAATLHSIQTIILNGVRPQHS